MGRDVALEIYDRNNLNKYTLPEGISFDASNGVVSVTSAAVPCVFTIRATGESSDGKALSRSVKVTVHGLSFDFGSGDEESVAEGYTDVNPLTTYTAQRGYGIEGSAVAEGSASTDNAKSDYLSGDFTFKAKVTKGKLSELVRVLTESANRPCVKIEAQYDDNGNLLDLITTPAKVSEAQSTVRTKNSLVTYWYSLSSMQPVIGE